MKNILEFTDKDCKSVEVSGGKGSSLAHMTQYGIPVPPGFVVSSKVFEEVVDNKIIKNILAGIDINNMDSISNGSNKLQNYVLGLSIPKEVEDKIFSVYDNLNLSLVAVRSSATSEDTKDASWAGELSTYLNTSRDDLLEKIKKCWSSLFSTRAIIYRFEKGFDIKNIGVGVVVQEMIQSKISGVCFTVHPVTGLKGKMLIEAVYGLGEAIVSGQVTPDSYLYDKDYDVVLRIEIKRQNEQLALPKNLKDIEWENVSKKDVDSQKLSYKQIIELANICKKVESYYKLPQDIEWAFWGNNFYITQSRPITTL